MAGEENFEKLDLKIEEDILSLDVNELVKLANKLELGEENIGKSRRVLSKLVRKTMWNCGIMSDCPRES